MQDLKIPEGYQRVMPYLIIRNASAFSVFMEAVFAAKEIRRTMRDDLYIMHAEIQIGDSTIMFADATGQYEPRTAGLFIYVPDADLAYHKALENGATSVMKPADQPYGRSSGVIDPYGNTLWITSPLQK